MSTVVQTAYPVKMRPGLEGMISDMSPSAVLTHVVETAAGITFGKACSWGTGPKGAILGGPNFIGLSVRDITLVGANVDPQSSAQNPLDSYGYRTNISLMTRGHMWVLPQDIVLPGEAVYYDETIGKLGNAAGGLNASGWVKFAANPAAGSTLVINGATLTFVATGATGDQANIGATLNDTLVNAVKAMNDSATAGFAALQFATDPAQPLGGSGGSDTILISSVAAGTAGNALAITSGPTGMTKSGATLTGGTAAATLINGAKWRLAAMPGQLAVVSLGIQY
jgi:hypothetical protein